MAVVPLSPSMLYHFNVIYNHAKSSLGHTDDTSLSLDVTRWIVDSLENVGLVNSYYHDRDKRPNLNLSEELDRVLSHSEITILILTPGFIRNCFYQYTHINAFMKLLDCTPERLVVLQFGLKADDQIPAALWGQDVISYSYDDFQLDSLFWCQLYNRVGYVMSLGTGDLSRKRSAKDSDNDRTPIHKRRGSQGFADVENTRWDPLGEPVNIDEHGSPSLYVHERHKQTGPLGHACNCPQTDLNKLHNPGSTFDPPLSRSVDLSRLEFDVSRQKSYETHPHEYSSLLDDSMQTRSTRSEDSDTEDSNETEAPRMIINESRFYDPHRDESDENFCLNPWLTLEDDVTGFQSTEDHVDPKSTRRKYQKKYEKLLYMDDRSSNQSDTDSSESDEASVNPYIMSEDLCMFPQDQDLIEKLTCLDDVNHEEAHLLQTDVGNALLKELDAIDPDYGWEFHGQGDSLLLHGDIRVEKDETKPQYWPEHAINDLTSTGDQGFVNNKPHVTVCINDYPESSEMIADKDCGLSNNTRHTGYLLYPRQDSQAQIFLQSHLDTIYSPSLTDGNRACPFSLVDACNPITTADFGDLNECNTSISFKKDLQGYTRASDGSEMEPYGKIHSELQMCVSNYRFDGKVNNNLRQRYSSGADEMYPSCENISSQKCAGDNNTASTSVVEFDDTSKTTSLADLEYITDQEKEENLSKRFEECTHSVDTTIVGQDRTVNNATCQAINLNNNLNLMNRKHMHDKGRSDSRRHHSFEDNGVPLSQHDSTGRYRETYLGARVHKEYPDVQDMTIADKNNRYTISVNSSSISSTPLETAYEMHQEKVSTLVSLYNTEDLLQRYSCQKDIKQRQKKEQIPNVSQQCGNPLNKLEWTESISHAHDESKEISEILHRLRPDERKDNNKTQSVTYLEKVQRPQDLNVADIEFQITKCDEKEAQCIVTTNDNLTAQQNDTFTRHGDFSTEADDNKAKMAVADSQQTIETKESNIMVCGHSDFLPVGFEGPDEGLSANRTESQPTSEYVGSHPNSPLNEGKGTELLSSISADSIARKCDEKETQCIVTTNGNVTALQNDTFTRHGDFSTEADDNKAKMAVVDSQQTIETKESNIMVCGHSNFLPVGFEGPDEGLSANSTESQPTSEYVGSHPNSPLNEGKGTELLSSISADSIGRSLTSNNKDVFRDRFLSLENRLNCLSHDINVVASVISSEVAVMQEEQHGCIMHQIPEEEQFSRSIQPDTCSSNEKLQENEDVESTSVESKMLKRTGDTIRPASVSQSSPEVTENMKQSYKPDKSNVIDVHCKLTVRNAEENYLTANEEDQAFSITRVNYQKSNVVNQQIIAAEISQNTAIEDDFKNMDGAKDIHNVISTLGDNQVLMLREHPDCCQGITSECIPHTVEAVNDQQIEIVSSEVYPRMLAAEYGAQTVHEELKSNNEVSWSVYEKDEHESAQTKSSPKYTLVQSITTQNPFLLNFVSLAKEVTLDFDSDNIVACILSEEITQDGKVGSEELSSSSELPLTPILRKEEDATVNCAITSSNVSYSSDIKVEGYTKRQEGPVCSHRSLETVSNVASKFHLKGSDENCSKDNGENLCETSASVQNDVMNRANEGNLAVQNIQRYDPMEDKECIRDKICLLNTDFRIPREDLDKSLNEIVSLKDSKHTQEPNLTDNEQEKSSEFNHHAVLNSQDCEEENDKCEDCSHTKTQTEDLYLINVGLMAKNDEHIDLIVYDYAKNTTRNISCEEHQRHGSHLSGTEAKTCDGESIASKVESKTTQSDECPTVFQQDQTTSSQKKCHENTPDIQSLHELPISPGEVCLHGSERQNKQDFCETKLNDNELQDDIALTPVKAKDHQTLPKRDFEKCVNTSMSTTFNNPDVFTLYRDNQLDCPVFVKRDSLVNILGNPQVDRWEEDILNASLLHATLQSSSEKKAANEKLKSGRSLGCENSLTIDRSEGCYGRHEHEAPCPSTSSELKAYPKEWTPAQMARKKRRGTNVDGLPSSSSSSSSSEEEQSDWLMSVSKGLCHGYSHPGMPFMG